MTTLTTPEILERTGLSVEYVLRYSTPEIDVLAISRDGEPYARRICAQLEGRGKLFGIEPQMKSCRTRSGSIRVYPLIELGEELPYHNSLEFVSWCDGLTERRPDDLPNVNPENTLVICDDYLYSGDTLRGVGDYLRESGYNFDNGNPLHFGVMESIMYREDCGSVSTMRNHIGLVRNLLPLKYY